MKFLLSALILSTFVLLFSFPKVNVPCANTGTCSSSPTAVIENNVSGTFLGQVIQPPSINEQEDLPVVLGTATESGEKHIYVDLATQTLYAYQGSDLFMQTLISSGKWGRTPPGEYKIWVKLRATRMSGGEGADAYDLPNVPYVMFFYNDTVAKDRGYSLHGAYWHNNFGHPMSHGCVNMRTIDAHVLYDWVNPVTTASTTFASGDDPGTLVTICKQLEVQMGNTPLCVE